MQLNIPNNVAEIEFERLPSSQNEDLELNSLSNKEFDNEEDYYYLNNKNNSSNEHISNRGNLLCSPNHYEQKMLTSLNNISNYNIFSFARHNNYSQLEALFIQGLDPNSKDEHGNTVLIIAAQNNNKRILKLALRYGARINGQNHMGNTALHFAKEYKYDRIYEYLIQKGANIDIKNKRGVKAKNGIKYKEEEKKLFLGKDLTLKAPHISIYGNPKGEEEKNKNYVYYNFKKKIV